MHPCILLDEPYRGHHFINTAIRIYIQRKTVNIYFWSKGHPITGHQEPTGGVEV
jgi:hypothetical protein